MGFFVLHPGWRIRLSFALCCAWLIAIPSAAATRIPAAADTLSPTESLEIGKISFKGNETLGEDLLKEQIRSRESPGWFSQFFYRTFGEKLGSPPEIYDAIVFEDDQRALKEFYFANGFPDAQITGETAVDTSHKKISLTFVIRENKRSFVDAVEYKGIEKLPPEVVEKIAHDQAIGKGVPYIPVRASAEIARILDLLANNGYPNARYDMEHSSAHRLTSTNNVFLTLAFIPGPPAEFGSVSIKVDPPRDDITDNLVVRELDFKPGDVYSREKRLSSERNLNRLGIFESARIDQPLHRDTMNPGSIPMTVTVRPRTRNEVAPELIVSDESGFFNLGAGLGYTNRNFFGDARTFNAHSQLRTQDVFRWDFHNVFGSPGLRDTSVIGTAELQFQILQPYLFTRTLSGTWTTTISAEKQRNYILSILRNKVGVSNQFATYTYGFFDWTLERVSPEILGSSSLDTLLSTLRQEDQPQFNSIFTFTLQRDKTNDPFSPSEGFFNSMSLEESGILPKILTAGNRADHLPFTQYYKATLMGRWYRDLTSSRFNILAWKLKSGYQNKYGESKYLPVSIPLNRRFFAGGSGSVRGWKPHELGAMSDELIPFGGNFMFEGSVEMRVNHFRGFGKFLFIRPENFWGVYFLDFGNVWSDIVDVKPRDIAVATGFGIRYETFFGPFRVDYGFRVYDPKGSVGKKSIFQKSFWNETFGMGVLHFGIGQAF